MHEDIKQTIWKAALLQGCPVKLSDDYDVDQFGTNGYYFSDRDWWNYYGGGPNADIDLVNKIISEKIEIDWENTKELIDDEQSAFQGTNSPSTVIPLLKGVLVTKSGDKYPWATDFGVKTQNLIDLLSIIKTYEAKSDQDVLATVKEKFKKLLKESTQYGSRPDPFFFGIYSFKSLT